MTAPTYKLLSYSLPLAAALLLSACGSDSDEFPDAATVSAAVAPKSLTLSWESVGNVSHYAVYHDPDGSSGYTKISDNLSTTSYTLPLAAHLTDWEDGRFMVEACNTVGCTASEAVYISDEVLDSIGYFKAEEAVPEALFGFALTLSGDGQTLAVGAPQFDHETGLTGSAAVAERSGAAYIYQAGDNGWEFETTIHNPAMQYGDWHLFGYSLALSEDGKLLVVGAPSEDNRGNRLNDDSNTWINESGAVYAFGRTENGEWQQQAYVKAPNVGAEQFFGMRVALTPAGDRLAVSAPYEASNAAGVNGDQTDTSIPRAGAVYVYDYSEGEWQYSAYIKPSTASHPERFCFDPRPDNNPCYEKSPSQFGYGLAFADDGQMLAVGAPGDSSIAGGINGDEEDYRGKSSGAVHILRMVEGQWQHTDYIKAAYPRIDDEFGYSLSLSADGTTLAVGAPYDDSSFDGIFDTTTSTQATSPPPTNTVDSGAAYVFHYIDGSWQQSLYIKPEAPVTDGYFGWSLSLSGDGKYLAVGTPRDKSGAEGITDNWTNTNATSSGAVYLYHQASADDAGDWALGNYIKASNTGGSDTFGRSLMLSTDGQTLAVAATGEDSNASEVDGNQENNDISNSGAVYLY